MLIDCTVELSQYFGAFVISSSWGFLYHVIILVSILLVICFYCDGLLDEDSGTRRLKIRLDIR